MKKVLIVHFGSWFSESYQGEIETLTGLLERASVSVERLERLPVNHEIAACDAIIFISLSFKKDAKKIKATTDRLVFVITGLPERGDDEFGVIPLDKNRGYRINARIISGKLIEEQKFLIRTDPDSVANRDQMDWRQMPEDRIQNFKVFLEEKPELKAILAKGGTITINRFNGIVTENVRHA
ncbi:MAG: hypothetical protein US63_C0022G0015 [Candidatus Moranbacteria bacterium GW2011_GWC2_37_8]|nr:MAG: hypothetical protein US63_C0022G0015 [Candidatus Moranbacteria bacterium GW2011_GWC2_37_8]KKQ60428.1 MAG: hypothetical protein US82_C0035G0003 [Parcubacteria group bacterium GW2011_GWC1_38_22]KKQ79762.1 MAG: hypothetical protein UT03_C0042G0003 [Candidatus Moranbacteria bacterium GW2011_GWD2_38_7]